MTTFTAQQVSAETGLSIGAVRNRSNHGWRNYVVNRNPIKFSCIPPKDAKKPATVATTNDLGMPGLLPVANKLALTDMDLPEPPKGTNNLGWAAYWAMRGLKVFPCESFIGTPLIGFSGPNHLPSANGGQIQRWWTHTPDADIGCFPEEHGMYVIEVHRFAKKHPDIDLSGALIVGRSMLGDWRYWFPGRAYTKLHALGEWVHIIGIGEYSFLPPSLAGGQVQ